MATDNLDLNFVVPGRRDEVRRRIEALDRYLASPKAETARMLAAELGLGRSAFYALAKIWRETRRPEMLWARARPRKPRRSLDDQQVEVISDAERRTRSSKLIEAIREAQRVGTERGITMPDEQSIRRQIRDMRAARDPGSARQDVDIVVDHCAIDIPVSAGDTVSAPTLTLVLDVRTGAVLGLALSAGIPNPTDAAAALLDALRRSPATESGGANEPARIGLGVGESDRWRRLVGMMTSAGFRCVSRAPGPRGYGRDMTGVLGLRPGGILLRPFMTAEPFGRRRVHPRRLLRAMSLAEAEEHVRFCLAERLSRRADLGRIERGAWETLAAGLLELVRSPDSPDPA